MQDLIPGDQFFFDAAIGERQMLSDEHQTSGLQRIFVKSQTVEETVGIIAEQFFDECE